VRDQPFVKNLCRVGMENENEMTGAGIKNIEERGKERKSCGNQGKKDGEKKWGDRLEILGRVKCRKGPV